MAQHSNRPLARRYALALYRLATTGNGVPASFATAVKNLRTAIGDSAHDWEMMAISPVLSSQQKKDVVEKILAAQKITDKKISDLLHGFFDLLITKGRLVMADLMLEEVTDMLLQDEGKLATVITTAKPMTDSDKKALEKQLVESLPKLLPKDIDTKMEKKLDNHLTMSYRVDETLLGGLTILVESHNIDLSVKSKLAKLEQKLS